MIKEPLNIDILSLPCIDDNRGRRRTIISHPVIVGIYKIMSPKGAVYIGLSTDVYYRIYSCYKKLRCKQQHKIYNSLIKYGVENHKFEIINIIENSNLSKSEIINELNKLEIKYIKEFNSFSDDNYILGMNLTRGGGSMELTAETRKNIGNKNRGRIVSKEVRMKIGQSHKGKPLSKEHKNKISKSNTGKIISEETRRKLSESHKGEKHSLERIQKKIGRKQKPETIAKRIAKISGDNHWIKKKGHSEETKLKISNSLKGKMVGDKNPAYGKKLSEETKKKISIKKIGVKRSEESKSKQGDSIRGEKHHNYGKKFKRVNG
ncbi:MAG: hypothetical protein IPJ01_10840 [Micavibrio sp.]|nr:hypothetical protein [Micavibrio sp.]